MIDSPAVRRGPRPRRFTLLDVMILVGATALGLAGARELEPPTGSRLTWALTGAPTVVVAAWALALLGLRAIPPRPRRRRIVRQPGWIACAASLAGLALGMASHASFVAVHYEQKAEMWAILPLWAVGVKLAPPFVLGAWAGLLLSGRWAGESSWVDRAGRLVGAYWVASLARALLQPVLSAYIPTL